MLKILAVGAGGFIGSICRYLFSLIRSNGGPFPWQTFLINIAGAFVIGIFVHIVAQYPQISEFWVLFVKVGICGGFTTFSAFSLETVSLFEKGRWRLALLYAASCVVLCIASVWLGKRTGAFLCKRA